MEMEKIMQWIGKHKGLSKFRRSVLRAVLAATIYNIWKARNEKYWNHTATSSECIVQCVKHAVLNRIKQVMPKRVLKRIRIGLLIYVQNREKGVM